MDKTIREVMEEAFRAGYGSGWDALESKNAHGSWMTEDDAWAEHADGHPDLDEPEAEPPTLGTCWTCAHDYIEDDGGHVCEWCLKSNAVSAWVKRAMPMGDDMPARDYTGPPCPGWKAKE